MPRRVVACLLAKPPASFLYKRINNLLQGKSFREDCRYIMKLKKQSLSLARRVHSQCITVPVTQIFLFQFSKVMNESQIEKIVIKKKKERNICLYVSVHTPLQLSESKWCQDF